MEIVKNRFHQGSKSIGNIMIVPNVRFFTLYSILNGPFQYRNEIMDKMADERIELISDLHTILATVDANQLKKWKAYYNKNDVHCVTDADSPGNSFAPDPYPLSGKSPKTGICRRCLSGVGVGRSGAIVRKRGLGLCRRGFDAATGGQIENFT